MKKLFFAIAIAIIVPDLCFGGTVSFSTILPAPIGSYDRLRLIPQSAEPVVCDASNYGVIYYDKNLKTLQLCRITQTWGTIGGAWQWREDSVKPIEYIRLKKNQPEVPGTTAEKIGWHVVINRTVNNAYEDNGEIVTDLDIMGDESDPNDPGVFIANEVLVSQTGEPYPSYAYGRMAMDPSNQIFMVEGRDNSGNFVPVTVEGDPILLQTRDTISTIVSTPPSNVRRVGIGVNNPQEALHVREVMQGTSLIARKNYQSPFGFIEAGDTDSAEPNKIGAFNTNTNTFGRIKIDGNPLSFQAKSLGRFGIGTVTPESEMHLNAKMSAKGLVVRDGVKKLILGPNTVGSVDVRAINTSGSSFETLEIDGNPIILQGLSGGNVGIGVTNPIYKVHVDGKVRAASFTPAPTAISDYRLKENIEPLKDVLAKIKKLRGVYFEWKDGRVEGRQVGVIAQEVKEVFPEAVMEDEQGFLSVSYEDLIAPLFEAVNELSDRNKKLKERLEALR